MSALSGHLLCGDFFTVQLVCDIHIHGDLLIRGTLIIDIITVGLPGKLVSFSLVVFLSLYVHYIRKGGLIFKFGCSVQVFQPIAYYNGIHVSGCISLYIYCLFLCGLG